MDTFSIDVHDDLYDDAWDICEGRIDTHTGPWVPLHARRRRDKGFPPPKRHTYGHLPPPTWKPKVLSRHRRRG